MAEHDVRAHAFGLAFESLIEVGVRLGEILGAARLLGEFAIELRDHRTLRFAGDFLQAARVLDRLVPVLLVLVDADQVLECGGTCASIATRSVNSVSARSSRPARM